MKRRLIAAGVSGLAVLVAALAAPAGAERGYFAATLAAGIAAFLALVGFCVREPGFGPTLGAAALLASWSILVTGLFRAGARWGAAAGHLAAGGAGLFLCSTHLLLDPVVAVAQNTAFRRFVIAFAVDANPSLILSTAFWERDLLMRTPCLRPERHRRVPRARLLGVGLGRGCLCRRRDRGLAAGETAAGGGRRVSEREWIHGQCVGCPVPGECEKHCRDLLEDLAPLIDHTSSGPTGRLCR